MVDTPGLNDEGGRDIQNLQSMENYTNTKLDSGDIGTSAFMFLLDGRQNRMHGSTVTMLENLTRSFGPKFWKHVIFCFVRMPFTEEKLFGEWWSTDYTRHQDGLPPIY